METLADWFGPLHPPMTHFPIVCSILAVAALAAGWVKKTDWLLKSAGALWVLAFFTAVPSVLLGHLFAHQLGMYAAWSPIPPETVLKGRLRFHAILGTLGLAASLLTLPGAWRLLRPKPSPSVLPLLLGAAAALLFGLAGHEGGEMVYGAEKAAPAASTLRNLDIQKLLDQVVDYRRKFVKMNSRMWNSRTHGRRWVNTYVSREAVEAYKDSDPLPEGSVVVKESFQDGGGKPSTVEGPLYVMVKGGAPAGTPGASNGWLYALRWDRPVPGNPERIQGPVTWLPGDPHLNSCVKCHDHFKGQDYLGGVPDEVANP
jgi:uncharacterized membrane protein